VKKIAEDASNKLKAETDRKIAEALARAEAHKVAAAEKGTKMANTKVEALRDGEKASIFFAKVMNEKRHAQAALRAYSAKKQRATRGAELASPKGKAVKAKFESKTEELKAVAEKKMTEALARAEAAKKAAAEKGALMSASKYAMVKALEGAAADAKKEALAARQAAAAKRALNLQREKRDKAVSMSTPVKKRGLSPNSQESGVHSGSSASTTSAPYSPMSASRFPSPPSFPSPTSFGDNAAGAASTTSPMDVASLDEMITTALPPAPPSEGEMQAAASALNGDLERGNNDTDGTGAHGSPERSGSPNPTGLKVVTLRRESPKGNGSHVVNIVTSAEEAVHADEIAKQVVLSTVLLPGSPLESESP
jgi:colicin import membrane protein